MGRATTYVRIQKEIMTVWLIPGMPHWAAGKEPVDYALPRIENKVLPLRSFPPALKGRSSHPLVPQPICVSVCELYFTTTTTTTPI